MSPYCHRRLLEVVPGGEFVEVRFVVASLDETNVEAMRDELESLLPRLAGRHAYVNLGAVEFLSSTWLGLFVSLFRELQARGGRLTLSDVRPEVYEVFEATRLTGILDVRARDHVAGRV